MHHKRDNFNIRTVTFPFICSNIPATLVLCTELYTCISINAIFQDLCRLSGVSRYHIAADEQAAYTVVHDSKHFWSFSLHHEFVDHYRFTSRRWLHIFYVIYYINMWSENSSFFLSIWIHSYFVIGFILLTLFSVFFTFIIVCLYLFLNMFLATFLSFLWKKCFNSDGQQFNEYQLNEELSLLIYDFFYFFILCNESVICVVPYLIYDQPNMKQFIVNNSGILCLIRQSVILY